MRDPLDELENFSTPGLTMDQLPAAEVRRRGTRMRRRNHALAAIGGVAAVAIIATPLALAATGDRTDTTPPVTNPSVTWVTEIPADFPLDVGMPEGTAVTPSVADTGLVVCGADADAVISDNPMSKAVAGASFSDGVEGRMARNLTLYADVKAAIAAMAALEQLVTDCGTDPQGTGMDLLNEVSAGTLGGDASLVVTQQSQDSEGMLADLTTMEVVRTGNAVYVVSSYTTAGGQQVVDNEVQRLAEGSAPVIDAMCTFSANPC